jgi:hypothetical protein
LQRPKKMMTQLCARLQQLLPEAGREEPMMMTGLLKQLRKATI